MIEAQSKAAFVNAQVAAAMIEAMGMNAENQQRESRGESMAYTERDFAALIDKHGIGHNTLCEFLS